MISAENYKKLSNEEINCLLSFIGDTRAYKIVLDFGKSEPTYSDYYIGKKNGKYWKHFRIEKLPNRIIQKFFHDLIKDENKKFIDSINKVIFKALDIPEDANNDIIKSKISQLHDMEILPILVKLFDLSMLISYAKYREDLNHLEQQYKDKMAEMDSGFQSKMETVLENHRKKVSDNNAEIQKLKNENLRLQAAIKDQKSTGVCSDDFIKFKNKLKASNRNDDQIINVCLSLIENQNMEQSQKKKLVIEKLFQEVQSKFNKNEDISELIIVEYILYKLLED